MKIKTLDFNITLLILCLLTVSCSKEMANFSYNEQDSITFHAYDAEMDNLSKTTLSGTAVLWNPGDQIMVYQGTKSSGRFTSTATESTAITDFKGSLSFIIGGQESFPEYSNIWAVYPYSAACGCDGNNVIIKVSAEQTAINGSFAPGVFPSVAKANNYSLAFYNVCGGIKFTVFQRGIKKVILRGNNSEVLSGKIKVGFSAGLPDIINFTETCDSIVVNAPDYKGFIPGEEYYIVSLPVQLKNGYSLVYVNDYGKTTYRSSDNAEIKRKCFGVLKDKDKVGIMFRDPIAKAACVNMFDLNGDGEVSFEEASKPTTLEGLFDGYEEVESFLELENFTSVKTLTGAFADCMKLKFVNIPNSIEEIGYKTFSNCVALNNIELPESIITIGKMAFRNCSSLYGIKLPHSLRTIGERAFYGTSIESVTLSNQIQAIDKSCFGSSLLEVVINSDTPPSILSDSFNSNVKIFVPDLSYSTYKTTQVWSLIANLYAMSDYYKQSDFHFDLSRNGNANCYVVSSAGKYKFKANLKGNSEIAVDGTPNKCELLWESSGTTVKPDIGTMIQNAKYLNNYIEFETAPDMIDGNACIAVKDASNKILWSWHIWMCKGFSPEETAQEYYNNVGYMMDRNLGAISIEPGNPLTNGLTFQWGRKDPFMGKAQYPNTDAVSTGTWGSIHRNSISPQTGEAQIQYSIEHPMTNIYDSGGYPWCIISTMWGAEKSIYDPCPIGWKVPSGKNDGFWGKALKSKTVSMDASTYGANLSGIIGFDECIWYPFASYWSCTSKNYNFSYDFRIYSSGKISLEDRAWNEWSDTQSHNPVRCCKE